MLSAPIESGAQSNLFSNNGDEYMVSVGVNTFLLTNVQQVESLMQTKLCCMGISNLA